MDIPPINDVNTPTKQSVLQPSGILKVATLVGKPLHIVEVRPDQPAKFHRKTDMYLIKAEDNNIYGFFNGNLRKWGIKAGDVITIKLVTGKYNFRCYEPVTINGKAQQTPNTSQELHGLDKKTLIKIAAESGNEIIFMSKIAPLLPGTKYAGLPVAEKLETFKRMYAKDKPASQPDTTKT
jgi:hypothetical protein